MSAPDQLYQIVDDSGHEWADAQTLDAALLGAKTIAAEESRSFNVIAPDGADVAQAKADGTVYVSQGARRGERR